MNIKHDKSEVLKSGMRLIRSKGYHNLGVDEICKVTGMTKGAFYNAFKSKEQFLTATITMYGADNVQRIHRELLPKPGTDAAERLRQFYVKMLTIQPQQNFAGCYINNIMSEMGIVSESVGQASQQEFIKFLEAIEPSVREAQQDGTLTDTTSARQLAELMHSTFYGVLTVAKSSQDYTQGIAVMNTLFNNLKPAGK